MVQFLESISLQTSNHFTLLLLKKHIDFAQIVWPVSLNFNLHTRHLEVVKALLLDIVVAIINNLIELQNSHNRIWTKF